jgi:hypothetical protein
MLRLEHDLTEADRYGFCRVAIPPAVRLQVHVGDTVTLVDPYTEAARTGVIREMSRVAWIMRVKLDKEDE